MAIAHYLREIGRGRDGARALDRAQAADLFGLILDGHASDLEVGAFCVAMRIKGETPGEMAGFLDATEARLARLPASDRPVVVLPSYNGARRLALLTPLLALLLAREGLPVLIHGMATEERRVYTTKVLDALDVPERHAIEPIAPGELAFVPTRLLCAGLARLLEVRRVIGLRNPAHSLVKQMNPCEGRCLIVASYTHPDYAAAMGAVFELTQANALLLRGTEGEPVADPRRLPQMTAFRSGRRMLLQEKQSGPSAAPAAPPLLPAADDVAGTAAYTRAVLAGREPVPAPIARQLALILQLTEAR
ncbi:MAG: Anthranilate phosphoribosyltransferase-like protein [Burkholderiaceae bacterium]|jgi:anthranilate phosphoribosyltransferase|nr:MAG: Anthranilate phosphoribosyltransferase-like protein [Burkholderiaceae bacterium]